MAVWIGDDVVCRLTMFCDSPNSITVLISFTAFVRIKAWGVYFFLAKGEGVYLGRASISVGGVYLNKYGNYLSTCAKTDVTLFL
jgi:hypothetical protein